MIGAEQQASYSAHLQHVWHGAQPPTMPICTDVWRGVAASSTTNARRPSVRPSVRFPFSSKSGTPRTTVQCCIFCGQPYLPTEMIVLQFFAWFYFISRATHQFQGWPCLILSILQCSLCLLPAFLALSNTVYLAIHPAWVPRVAIILWFLLHDFPAVHTLQGCVEVSCHVAILPVLTVRT